MTSVQFPTSALLCLLKLICGPHPVAASFSLRLQIHRLTKPKVLQTRTLNRFPKTHCLGHLFLRNSTNVRQHLAGWTSWCCTVIPDSLVFLLVYSPKMKGANWLKLICHQGRSLVNIFSLWNIWYKSVVLSLIWLHSLVCQIQDKRMS